MSWWGATAGRRGSRGPPNLFSEGRYRGTMDRLDARYPFFESARRSVESLDASLPELIASDAPAVDRGVERVRSALVEGRVASDSPGRYDVRAELLSYPIARVLVSLLESDAAVEKYAAAEARTAVDRLREDIDREEELRSVPAPSLDLDRVLSEFGLADAVRPAAPRDDPGTYRIDVGRYLSLASPEWGDEWRLVRRELDGGELPVTRDELFRLLRTAIRDRVAAGLPFEGVTEEVAAGLDPAVADLRRLLSDRMRVPDVEVVAPELFPPCMENLVTKARERTELSSVESFSLMAFLTGIGMTADEIVAFCGETSLDAEAMRYQIEYLRDDGGSQYPPPSCETLAAYGVCHNGPDDRGRNHWKVAAHPLAYYEARVAEADSVVDWRERPAGSSGETGRTPK